MARKPRIHFPGAVYHVILRGNDGQNIFYSQADRVRLYLLLQEGIERFGHRIHAFCLMTNHVHAVIQVGEVPLSKIIQNISFRYTRYINRRKKRIGHLFQGRYKALLIDADSYLLELVRYIHNNPIRVGLAQAPEHYQWSSHRAYTGTIPISWLTTDWVLSQFATNEKKARKLFHEFCMKGIREEHGKEFHSGNFEGRILGDDRFSEKALARAEEKSQVRLTVKELVGVICKNYRINQQTFVAQGKHQPAAEARAIAAYLVQNAEKLSLTDLGRYVRRDISALSRSAGRLRARLRTEQDLSGRLAAIEDGIKKKSKCQA
ncbi:MAG: transposase [Thermodesulfobacteriota bacterium]|nr:transposase [Thermodesulfobacteriota bacterium]